MLQMSVFAEASRSTPKLQSRCGRILYRPTHRFLEIRPIPVDASLQAPSFSSGAPLLHLACNCSADTQSLHLARNRISTRDCVDALSHSLPNS
jgi:hypothetical protein